MRNQDSNPFLKILFLICWDIRIRTWISGVRAPVTAAKKISLQIHGVSETAGALTAVSQTAQIQPQRWRRQCQNFQTEEDIISVRDSADTATKIALKKVAVS
jgi:hypothetical protein